MNMPFLSRLEKEILLMCGAIGTMLHSEGADLGGCIGQWITEHPVVFQNLMLEYFQAGCLIGGASSSGLNRFRLEKVGLRHKVKALNKEVAEIAKAVMPENGYIAGAIGPTGRFLKPLGDVDFKEVSDCYEEQVEALAEGEVDLIYILTMYDLEESIAAIRAVKRVGNLPVMLSMAFNAGTYGYRTMMGVSPEEMVRRFQEEGVDVIGCNCGSIDLNQIGDITEILHNNCLLPLIVRPNAGFPRMVDGKETYLVSPEQLAEHVPRWVKSGARILSACCGSTPQHLKEMFKRLTNSKCNLNGYG